MNINMGKAAISLKLGSITQKKMKNKRISNPYGNVYRRRRSISCPSTPVRNTILPTNIVLMAVSETLKQEYVQKQNDEQVNQQGNIIFVKNHKLSCSDRK